MPSKKDTELPRRRPSVIRPDGSIPPGWLNQKYKVRATCRTPGCSAEGLADDVFGYTNPDGIDRVQCYRCDEWIEDLVDLPVGS
jgi:hypothetical protein